MNLLPKSFCRLPWNGLDISPQGGFKPCCKYNREIARDIDEYFSSTELAELRAQFLAGEQPSGCQRCWDDEQAGIPSKRQIDDTYTFGGSEPDLQGLKTLSFPFGNTCNLACVPCSSHSSSRWLAHDRKLPSEFSRPVFLQNRFYEIPGFVARMADLCDDVIHIDIPGGEPFYAEKKVHLEFLSRLRNPNRIKLHYTTNATIFPDQEFWDIWDKFQGLDIQLSIDGVADRFEYLRYPASWSVVTDNTARYQACENLQISISHTVSWLNVMYLDELFDWCQAEGLPEPYLGAVSRPAYLDPRCLPHTAKFSVIDRLSASEHAPVRQFAQYLSQHGPDVSWDQCLRWIDALDLIRNRDWKSVFSELYKLVQNP